MTANWSYRGAEKGFPWAGGDPWQDTPSPYSGVGKGYDIMGRWLGFEAIGEVYWSKGIRGEDGKVPFGPRKNTPFATL